jgi:hypothetical protein
MSAVRTDRTAALLPTWRHEGMNEGLGDWADVRARCEHEHAMDWKGTCDRHAQVREAHHETHKRNDVPKQRRREATLSVEGKVCASARIRRWEHICMPPRGWCRDAHVHLGVCVPVCVVRVSCLVMPCCAHVVHTAATPPQRIACLGTAPRQSCSPGYARVRGSERVACVTAHAHTVANACSTTPRRAATPPRPNGRVVMLLD